MTEDDQRRFLGFQRIQRLRNGPHGNQFATLDARLPVFEGFTNVDKSQLFTSIESLFHFTRGNLQRKSEGHDRL